MKDKDLIHERLVELYKNREQWVDPYDSECIENRYMRKIVKILLYFLPNILYKCNLVKRHVWHENLELLGKCFLKIGDVENAKKIYLELCDISNGNYYWGLPIDWKSSKYVFPKGLMMSTTTSEIALFFIDLKKSSNIVKDEILNKIAYNLLDGLNRVYEDEDKLILGYTPYDDYRINNSNLLVAAALHEIGKVIEDEKLIRASIKITNACIDGISDSGGVPYFMNGFRYDSYHQVFSLRSLYFLKNESVKFERIYYKAINFLKEELMDCEGNVYLSSKKDIIDMQGAAEALGFFKLINEEEIASKIEKQIDYYLKTNEGEYIQRFWKSKFIAPVKSRTLFTRQGELRLILSKID